MLENGFKIGTILWCSVAAGVCEDTLGVVVAGSGVWGLCWGGRGVGGGRVGGSGAGRWRKGGEVREGIRPLGVLAEQLLPDALLRLAGFRPPYPLGS